MRKLVLTLAAVNLAFVPLAFSATPADALLEPRYCACEKTGDGQYDECCKVDARDCNGCIVKEN